MPLVAETSITFHSSLLSYLQGPAIFSATTLVSFRERCPDLSSVPKTMSLPRKVGRSNTRGLRKLETRYRVLVKSIDTRLDTTNIAGNEHGLQDVDGHMPKSHRVTAVVKTPDSLSNGDKLNDVEEPESSKGKPKQAISRRRRYVTIVLFEFIVM